MTFASDGGEQAAAPPRRVLFIALTFPPRIGGAICRNVQFARHLPGLGWQPRVLTVADGSSAWQDPSSLAQLGPRAAGVARGRTLAGLLPRPARPRSGAAGPARASLHRQFIARARNFALDWLLVPDRDVLWLPYALPLALRLLARERYHAIYSTGPPFSAHLLALALLRRHPLPWVADCADPWSQHPYLANGHPLRRALEARWERLVFARADRVISPTATQTTEFAARYRLDPTKFVTIPNGYDEDEFAGLKAPEPATRRPFTLLHSGSFFGIRSPGPLLEALARLAPDIRRDVRLVLAGYVDRANQALIDALVARHALGDAVQQRPFVPRRESLAMMLRADALVLVTDPGDGGRALVPQKSYEYLRAGRPILALTPPGETARLLQRAGGCTVVGVDDVPAIAQALADLYARRDQRPQHDAHFVRSFEFARLTRRLADLLEEACRANQTSTPQPDVTLSSGNHRGAAH